MTVRDETFIMAGATCTIADDSRGLVCTLIWGERASNQFAQLNDVRIVRPLPAQPHVEPPKLGAQALRARLPGNHARFTCRIARLIYISSLSVTASQFQEIPRGPFSSSQFRRNGSEAIREKVACLRVMTEQPVGKSSLHGRRAAYRAGSGLPAAALGERADADRLG